METSNSRRSKLDETWMSIDGEVVATTPVWRYSPLFSVRSRMSLSLVAMTSWSIGNPIFLAA
ncbi:hypothetical protein D3C72_2509130 [compost metagenome]